MKNPLKALRMNTSRQNRGFAIVAVFLFVLSTFSAVALTQMGSQIPTAPSAASTPIAAGNTLPYLNFPGAPAAVKALSPTGGLAQEPPAIQALARTILGGGTFTGDSYKAAISAIYGQYGPTLTGLVNSTAWNALAAYAQNTSADSGNSGLQVADLFGIASGELEFTGIALVGGICASTAGIGCIVAIIVIGAIVLFDTYQCAISHVFGQSWGCSANPAAASYIKAVKGQAIEILNGFGAQTDIQAIAIHNELQVLNLTQTALSYEAAAQAETQVGNASFNYELSVAPTVAQGSVAQQLGSIYYADSLTLASIYAWAGAAANYYEAYGNGLPNYCPVVMDAIPVPQDAANQRFSGNSYPDCGGGLAAPTNYAVLEGAMMPGMRITLPAAAELNIPAQCPQFYIQNGSELSIAHGQSGFTLELIPSYDHLVNHTGYINLTFGGYGTQSEILNYTVTSSVPAQGYYVCHSGTALVPIYLSWAMPLDSGALHDVADFAPDVQLGEPATIDLSRYIGGYGAAIATPITSGTCNSNNSGLQVWQFDSAYQGGEVYPDFNAFAYGGNTNASVNSSATNGHCEGAQMNLVSYLYVLQNNSAKIGFVYWSFVRHVLGITNYHDIPIDCLIPNPSELFPPNMPISNYENMSTTVLLQWYLAQLEALGRTFNPNTTGLNSTSICGHHPSWGLGNNTSIGFGVYGVGWIFQNGVGVRSSDGAVAQQFGSPSTWAYSGEFYMAPALNAYSVPLNQTFSLGVSNPVTFFILPFSKAVYNVTTGTNSSVINRTGPEWCLFHSIGCYTSAWNFEQTGWAYGNSTLNAGTTGSVYPNNVLAQPAISVFLTACFVAVNGSSSLNPVYASHPGTCNFGISTIDNTGWVCNGTVLLDNGVPVGTCNPPPYCTLCFTVPPGACGFALVGSIAALFTFAGNTWACAIAWVILIVIVIIVIAVVVRIYRGARGER